MRGLVFAARIVLGLMLLVFGLNHFVGFAPMPPPPPAGGAFLGALVASGYVMPLVKVLEIGVGALLLAGLWLPLAAVVLMPIALNIFLYNAVLAPSVPGFVMGALVLGATTFLIWAYRDVFAALRDPRPSITGVPPAAVPARVAA